MTVYYVSSYVKDPLDATQDLKRLFSDVAANNGGTIIFDQNKDYHIAAPLGGTGGVDKNGKYLQGNVGLIPCIISTNGFINIIGNNATLHYVGDQYYHSILTLGSDTATGTQVHIDALNVNADGIVPWWGQSAPNNFPFNTLGAFHIYADNISVRNCQFRDLYYSTPIHIRFAYTVDIENLFGVRVGGGGDKYDTVGDGLYFDSMGYKEGSTDYKTATVNINNCVFYGFSTVEISGNGSNLANDASHSSRCGVCWEYNEGRAQKFLAIKNSHFYNFQRGVHVENCGTLNVRVISSSYEDFSEAILYATGSYAPGTPIETFLVENCKFIRNKEVRKFSYGYGSVFLVEAENFRVSNCSFNITKMPIILGYSQQFSTPAIFDNCEMNIDTTMDTTYLKRMIGQNAVAKLYRCRLNLVSQVNIDYAFLSIYDCDIVGSETTATKLIWTYQDAKWNTNSLCEFNGNKVTNCTIQFPAIYDCVVRGNSFILTENSVLVNFFSSPKSRILEMNDNGFYNKTPAFIAANIAPSPTIYIRNFVRNYLYNCSVSFRALTYMLDHIMNIEYNTFESDIRYNPPYTRNYIGISNIRSRINRNIILYDSSKFGINEPYAMSISNEVVQRNENVYLDKTTGVKTTLKWGKRPPQPYVGELHFDTTLNKPIWCKVEAVVDKTGAITNPAVWVDATGLTV